MAMEKPIVVGARGVSGLKEQVVSAGPGQTGIHVDGGSPADIAWGVKKILSQSRKGKAVGAKRPGAGAQLLHLGEGRPPDAGRLRGLVQSAGRK